MRIEDTPYAFTGTSPIDKLRRSRSSMEDINLDDFDLSFLDLLGSVSDSAPSAVEPKAAAIAKAEDPEKTKDAEAKPVDGKPRLSLVRPASVSPLQEDGSAEVEQELALLKTDLTETDVQYLKQAVIPGLPILMGSVPVENVFPPDSEGGISYKGFEISSRLAELIRTGYKTGRPVRVELDNNSAVVLKIRNGQVSAEFVSADRSAALFMQQELDDLRHRMAMKNLPVGTLEYKYQNPRQSREQKDERENESPEES